MTLAVALLVLAFVLVVLELAFPSFGLLSLGAATAYAFSIVLAFQQGTTAGWTFVGLGILLLPMAVAFGLKILPKTPIGRRLFLQGPEAREIQHGTLPADLRSLIGEEGEALTDLRPSGTVHLAGWRIDVVAGGRFVHRGDRVRVTDVSGTRVVVQAVPRPAETPPPEGAPGIQKGRD